MADTFGARLRASRTAAGVSLGELAKRITYSKSYLSKIENDLKPPTADVARRCDHELETGGTLVAMVPGTLAPVNEPGAADADMWVLTMDDDELRFQPMDRREAPPSGSALLGFAITRGVLAEPDEEVITALRSQFDQHRALGALASPALVLGPLVAQVNTIRTLAADSPEPARSRLLRLGSRAMEYAGWMSQEAGKDTAALWWTERAVEFAELGGDPHLASYALFRRAELALYREDGMAMVELAVRAQADPQVGARILGLAARAEAQGHALAGDASGHLRALDRASELLSRPSTADGPELGSTVTDQIALVHGWSLVDLGRPGAAAELLDQQVPAITPSARRARARFGARRVLAHATHGEVDHACTLARGVLADATHVDSATVRADLKRLVRTLTRWQNHPAVQELLPDLRAALHVRQPR
jgi:transcriptional regulator with XRE-family HTH domain